MASKLSKPGAPRALFFFLSGPVSLPLPRSSCIYFKFGLFPYEVASRYLKWVPSYHLDFGQQRGQKQKSRTCKRSWARSSQARKGNKKRPKREEAEGILGQTKAMPNFIGLSKERREGTTSANTREKAQVLVKLAKIGSSSSTFLLNHWLSLWK